MWNLNFIFWFNNKPTPEFFSISSCDLDELYNINNAFYIFSENNGCEIIPSDGLINIDFESNFQKSYLKQIKDVFKIDAYHLDQIEVFITDHDNIKEKLTNILYKELKNLTIKDIIE